MRHKLCRSFHPWCPGVKNRCLWLIDIGAWLCPSVSEATLGNIRNMSHGPTVIGPLCGEFTAYRWIPITKASDAELWWLLRSPPEQTVEQTMETPVIWDATLLIITSLQFIVFAWNSELDNNPHHLQSYLRQQMRCFVYMVWAQWSYIEWPF